MSINFPILNTQQQFHKPLWKLKRDLACVNKLAYMHKHNDRIKIATDPVQIRRRTKTQVQVIPGQTIYTEQFKDQCQKQQQQLNREVISLSIPSLTVKTEPVDSPFKTKMNFNKKTTISLNKNFNKTRTDWDHNFIGNKYLQKIKQQLSKTKSQKFTNSALKVRKQNRSKIQIGMKLKISLDNNNWKMQQENTGNYYLNYGQQSKSNSNKYERGLSQDQLRRIKAIKDKRKQRISKRGPQIYCTKNIKNIQVQQESLDLTQFQILSPWEENNNLSMSSLWGKKA